MGDFLLKNDRIGNYAYSLHTKNVDDAALFKTKIEILIIIRIVKQCPIRHRSRHFRLFNKRTLKFSFTLTINMQALLGVIEPDPIHSKDNILK